MAAPLVHQVNVKSTPETIYKAVSTAQGLASFWISESKAEPKVGSIASFGFGGPTQRMRVDELVPGNRVKWTGLADLPNRGDSTVSWGISPTEIGETRPTIPHGADRRHGGLAGHRSQPSSQKGNDVKPALPHPNCSSHVRPGRGRWRQRRDNAAQRWRVLRLPPGRFRRTRNVPGRGSRA